MKKTYILLMAAAALILGACHHATHYTDDLPEGEDTGKYPASTGLGFLGNDLAWEEIADIKSEITHLKYTVTGANEVLEEKEFSSPAEASEWMIPLPVGEYDVLVAANMDKANGFELSETVPTKSSLTLPDTYTKLTNASSNPVQAWNGIAHVVVLENKMATVHLELDRLMALFTLKIANVPAGTVIDVSMRNAADYVTLTRERSEAGHWGVPSEEISDDIILGRLNENNAATAINEFKVFPTATGLDKTILMFHIKTNHDLELDYVGEAPIMENGKRYILEMDYEKLSPFMYITSVAINDWTDGWSFAGEVLNPKNN